MNEIQLIEQLEIIKNKLRNNEVLDDDEYTLFTLILFILGVICTVLVLKSYMNI